MALRVSSLSSSPALRELAVKIDHDGNGRLTKVEVKRYRAKVDCGEVNLTKREARALGELERRVLGKTAKDKLNITAGAVSVATFLTGDRAIDASGNLNRLNKTQRAVVADVTAKAEQRSEAARSRLIRRAQDFGYSVADLDLALTYIATKAPICMNFHPDKSLELTSRGKKTKYKVTLPRDTGRLIDALIVDGEYKNQFETGISGFSPTAYPGGGRDYWEKKLFESGYHTHRLVSAERPKYGALNAGKLRGGPADYYGSCFLVLKQGVKARTSFTAGDSSGCGARDIGTAAHFQHVMGSIRDVYFKTIMDIALGKKKSGAGLKLSYIEAQIHGPVDFATDVDHLVANRKFKGTPYEAKLIEFAKQGGFKIRWSAG